MKLYLLSLYSDETSRHKAVLAETIEDARQIASINSESWLEAQVKEYDIKKVGELFEIETNNGIYNLYTEIIDL